MCTPAIRDYMVRYSEISIPHTEFGIRESEFGIWKSGKLWREALRGLPHFAPPPVNIGPNAVHRKSSWCGISLLTTSGMVR